MAITINWTTKVISIPQADLTPVSGTLYELDVDALRLALKTIEDSEEGVSFPDTHRHNTAITLSGVTYARTFEVINGYTITFEDTGSPYTVRFVGANHNIADVTNYVSEVSLIVGNSGGLIVTTGEGGASPTDIANAVWGHATADTLLEKMAVCEAILRNKTVTDPVSGIMTVYAQDGVTVLLEAQLYEGVTTGQPYRGQGAERRERLE